MSTVARKPAIASWYAGSHLRGHLKSGELDADIPGMAAHDLPAFDPAIIERYVENTYRKATAVFLGSVGAGVGGVIGYLIGDTRAFLARLQGQTALAQIEAAKDARLALESIQQIQALAMRRAASSARPKPQTQPAPPQPVATPAPVAPAAPPVAPAPPPLEAAPPLVETAPAPVESSPPPPAPPTLVVAGAAPDLAPPVTPPLSS